MKIKGLILDDDETIAETEELHRETFNLIIQKTGLEWYWSRETCSKLLNTTGGIERLKIFPQKNRNKKILVSDSEVIKLHKLKTNLFFEILKITIFSRNRKY